MAKAGKAWANSNLSLFGTDVEKKVKEAAAAGEPQWQAVKACTEPRVFIWRIEKYKVVEWPKDEYGKFYSGDSYIILNIWQQKNSPALNYDAHFWIGKKSSQDEYATAAYKTVELDMFLSDAAVQHREVQAYESDLFKSYFPTITVMKGGIASGFNKVKPEQYVPRLFHFCGVKRNIEVKEVKPLRSNLKKDDVFILDCGLEIFQWNGETSNKDERMKAMQYTQQLKSDRAGKPTIVVYESSEIGGENKFYKCLRDEESGKRKEKQAEAAKEKHTILYRLSDTSGELKMEKIDEGPEVDGDMLTEDDVFIMDNGKLATVYVGSKASADEKRNALSHAHKYLMKTDHPMIPIMAVKGDQVASGATDLSDMLKKK